MKLLKRLLLSIVALLALSIAAVCLWMMRPYPVQQDAIDQALRSDEAVQVSRGEYLVFTPANVAVDRGLIFYPGGKTDPTSFAPLLRALAEAGLRVVAVPMPLNTAFLDVDSATRAIAAFPDINHWFLAGHSLGGVAAAMYAQTNANRLDGLILWAAYPAADISSPGLDVLSIYAHDDLNTTLGDISKHQDWLPENTVYVEIEGNHWQFGHFSDSQNQQPQKISREQQQSQILSATLAFIGQ